MNAKTALLSLLIFILFVGPALAQESFYYGRNGVKVPITPSPNLISIKFKDTASPVHMAKVFGQGVIDDYQPLSAAPGFYQVRLKPDLTTDTGNQVLASLRVQPDIALVSPVYLMDGAEAIPFDQFVVRFQPSVTTREIEALNKKYQVEVVHISQANPHRYTLRLSPSSKRSVVNLAQLYFESLPSVYAMPDFITPIELHSAPPADPFYAYQYYLNQGNDIDIDAPEAWNISKGRSDIVVAVLDQGVSAHEDLPASRLVPGFDAFGKTGGAPGGNEAHGMASAGIIAASHNSLGVAGIAPHVKIMPIRIADEYRRGASDAGIAQAIETAWMNGAHVLSNSWAYRTCNIDHRPVVQDAIEEAMRMGRGGLGSVVVFSAGNNAKRNRSIPYYGCIDFPANVSGVLSVGAVTRSGAIQHYSPRDAKLGVVAPSGDLEYALPDGSCNGKPYMRIDLRGDVWSLDISGSPGRNPADYDGFCCFA